jgi:hypothetical protein
MAEHHMPPIDLGKGLVAASPSELADMILSVSDAQVLAKGIEDPAGRDEFDLSTVALNTNRVLWRCRIEWKNLPSLQAILEEVKREICARRDLELDDLDSAIEAVSNRTRLPFGLTAIELAWRQAHLSPLRLLHPDLAGKRVPTAIATIAYYLDLQQEGKNILLPIDSLRAILQQRKIVVGGAVKRLVEAGLVVCVDEKYYTGKAKEFQFIGREGEHYEHEDPRQA